ncbi:hypothetical protein [Actinocrispum wychmicini]|nr:hypothetical protein [Actinocrispum wychmicini]
MTDPILLTMAAALAGDVQVGDDAAWAALSDIVDTKPQIAAALAEVREQRSSAESIDSLAQRLQEASTDDADFAGRLSDAWTTAARGPRVEERGNFVVGPGPIANLVQANEITGLTLGRDTEPTSWLGRFRRGSPDPK